MRTYKISAKLQVLRLEKVKMLTLVEEARRAAMNGIFQRTGRARHRKG